MAQYCRKATSTRQPKSNHKSEDIQNDLMVFLWNTLCSDEHEAAEYAAWFVNFAKAEGSV